MKKLSLLVLAIGLAAPSAFAAGKKADITCSHSQANSKGTLLVAPGSKQALAQRQQSESIINRLMNAVKSGPVTF
ncbi:MAG: hypothetical protein CL675_00845 [Bdellovibrionaceae bacterium]|nr:hypothetical protein [Pseudobdellovibrionaceae bacterium]|tara:strand:+ start:499 stop:723 length:225 start_codon:yes stop_codon:yes gene_type:complete